MLQGNDETHSPDERERLTRQVVDYIHQLLPKRMRGAAIEPSHRLAELGLDSMRLLELVFLLQNALKLDIDDEEFGRLRVETVGDVVASVERLLRAKR
jgi:acyl carrier protein